MIQTVLCLGSGCPMLSKERWLLSLALMCQVLKQLLSLGRTFKTDRWGRNFLLFLCLCPSAHSFVVLPRTSIAAFLTSGQGYCVETPCSCVALAFALPLYSMVSYLFTIANGWIRAFLLSRPLPLVIPLFCSYSGEPNFVWFPHLNFSRQFLT